MQKGHKLRSRKKTYLQTAGTARKSVSSVGSVCGYCTCLFTSPGAFGGLLWSPYGPPKCCPKTNRLPDISPAKMGFFGISRELQLGVCNHGEPCASPHMAREGELFHREEKDVERAMVKEESMVFHWLSPCQERSLSSSYCTLLWS